MRRLASCEPMYFACFFLSTKVDCKSNAEPHATFKFVGRHFEDSRQTFTLCGPSGVSKPSRLRGLYVIQRVSPRRSVLVIKFGRSSETVEIVTCLACFYMQLR